MGFLLLQVLEPNARDNVTSKLEADFGIDSVLSSLGFFFPLSVRFQKGGAPGETIVAAW
jgi:hypothetical protein